MHDDLTFGIDLSLHLTQLWFTLTPGVSPGITPVDHQIRSPLSIP
jgi:hypothetical protein